MGSTTFSGPVKSLAGFNPSGYNNIVNFSGSGVTTALTVSDHGGRILTVNDATGKFTVPEIVATEPSDKTDPGQLCNLGTKFRFFIGTASTGVEINLSGSDEFLGVLYQIDTDSSDAVAAYPAEAADNFVSIDFNGTTKGGRVGSYVEIEAVASAVWLVSGTVLASGSVATPFAT
jgi:hypothetical protein